MPFNIFVTRQIPQAGLDLLAPTFSVKVNPFDRNLEQAEIIENIKDADAIISLLTDVIDRKVIDAAPHLKCISNYAVGYNNIDVEYASSKGIVVCNTPGVLTESTADLAWALIMSCARRIVESDVFTRASLFTGWEPMLMLGHDVYNKTLGIVGMGRIGRAVARRAKGFNMKVLGYNRSPRREEDKDLWQQVDLPTLLKESDFISLHLPLTEETRYLIGEKELNMMKESAILINTARGAVVDETALIRMLKQGRIAAAGFDVYEHEPQIPKELLELKNVVLLPHIGSASIETRTEMAVMAAKNALAVIRGQEPPARVN